MSLDPIAFDPRSFYPLSFDPLSVTLMEFDAKSFYPMSVTHAWNGSNMEVSILYNLERCQ